MHWAVFGKGLEDVVAPTPGNCTAFGEVRDDVQLNHIYAAADLFVMPSLQESFGKVTVEAMASGTPVVAYASTPAEEMLRHGETGWLVPHGDVKAFLATLKEIRSLPRASMESMGAAAHEIAQRQFSADAVADEHIALYNSLLQTASQ